MTDPISSNNLKGASGAGGSAKYASDVFMQGSFVGTNGSHSINTTVNNAHPNRGRCKNLKTDGCMVLVKNFIGPNNCEWHIYDTMSGRGSGDNKYGLPFHGGLQNTAHPTVVITDSALQFHHSSGDPANTCLDNSYTYYCVFKQADKFFSMGTYTGAGSGNRVFSHGLGCRPGMLWIKKYGGTGGNRDFLVWHAGAGVETGYYRMDDDGDFTTYFKVAIGVGNTTTFTIDGGNSDVNETGGLYAWYAFGDGSDNTYGVNGDKSIVKAGSFNPSSIGVNVNLGFQPAWGTFKRKAGYSSAPNPSPWKGRPYFESEVNGGFTTGDVFEGLMYANSTRYACNDTTGSMFRTHNQGFEIGSYGNSYSQTDKTQLYYCVSVDEAPAPAGVAINDVFHTRVYSTGTSGAVYTGFSKGYELAWFDMVANGTHSQDNRSHLFRRGGLSSQRIKSGAMQTRDLEDYHNQTSINAGGMGIGGHPLAIDSAVISKGGNYYRYGNRTPSICNQARSTFMSKLAPIMTTLVYVGDGTGNRTIPHNLGVQPEAMTWKSPNSGGAKFFSKGSTASSSVSDTTWWKYWTDMEATNQAANFPSGETGYLTAVPDETNVYVASGFNQDGHGYYVILWASYPGILKIGGYNGNGTNTGDSQNIDCGFGSSTKPGWLFIRRFTNQQDFDPSNDWYYFSQNIGFNDGGGGTKDRWISPNSAKGTTNWGGSGNLYDQNVVNTYAGGFAVVQDNTQSESGSTSYRLNLNKSGESYHYLAYAPT